MIRIPVILLLAFYTAAKTIEDQSDHENWEFTSTDDWRQQKWNSIFELKGPSFSTEPADEFLSNDDSSKLKSFVEDQVFVATSEKTGLKEKADGSASGISPANGPGDPICTETKEKEFESTKSDLFHESSTTEHPPLKEEIRNEFRTMSSRSFIFNPGAQPEEQFQNCTTPKNESGRCRYIQHCMIPSIVGALNEFMNYICIIEDRFIGVCCPEHPVTSILVKEENNNETASDLNSGCGVSTNTRIVGGNNADPKAWPWMVALLSKSRKRFYCGGVLINDRYVLTAAHCTFGIPRNEIVARVGEYDFKDVTEFHDDYSVAEIKRHGKYNSRTLQNDIALLKLERPVEFNEFVKTICFPKREENYVGKTAALAGWGNLAGGGRTSDVLQEASFPVVSNEECSNGHGVPISSSLICTGSKTGEQGACNGDSGGPLMLLDDDDRWKTIGIVSWGRRGCNPEFPTVYTRVSHFLEWIKEHSN